MEAGLWGRNLMNRAIACSPGNRNHAWISINHNALRASAIKPNYVANPEDRFVSKAETCG
jgi:hypothetical protein